MGGRGRGFKEKQGKGLLGVSRIGEIASRYPFSMAWALVPGILILLCDMVHFM